MKNINKIAGKKIKELREKAGLTQEQLAKKMGISRSSLSLIENGEKNLTLEEVLKFSQFLNTDLNILIGKTKMPEVVLPDTEHKKPFKPEIRISVPQKNLRKFKEVLLYILNKVGSKPNIGETVLYKILYFIDFNFYEKYEEQLIGATYIKNHYGPTPIEFKKIVEDMIKDKEIIKVEHEYFQYPQIKYLPLRQPDLSVLKAHELEMIDSVLDKLSDFNASQISEYSHKDVPWLVTEDNKIIDYETVFYRTPEFSVRDYGEDASNWVSI